MISEKQEDWGDTRRPHRACPMSQHTSTFSQQFREIAEEKQLGRYLCRSVPTYMLRVGTSLGHVNHVAFLFPFPPSKQCQPFPEGKELGMAWKQLLHYGSAVGCVRGEGTRRQCLPQRIGGGRGKEGLSFSPKRAGARERKRERGGEEEEPFPLFHFLPLSSPVAPGLVLEEAPVDPRRKELFRRRLLLIIFLKMTMGQGAGDSASNQGQVNVRKMSHFPQKKLNN